MIGKKKTQHPPAGGPIQDKINALRNGGKPSPNDAPQERNGRTAGPGGNEDYRTLTSEEDEAFLKQFARHLDERNGSKNKRPHPLEVAIERGEEFKRREEEQRRKTAGQPVGSPSPSPASAPPRPAGAAPTRLPSQGTPRPLPPKGAILLLPGGEVAVFHKDLPAKDYQLLYLLQPDGSLHPEGIHLNGYQYRQIGQLPREDFGVLIQDLTWNRDHIIFHLERFKDAALIPQPTVAPTTQAAPPSPTREATWPAPEQPRREEEPVPRAPTLLPSKPEPVRPAGLRRGQRFRITFGSDRAWEAVYWSRDEQGTLVAHKTEGPWTLMHLDLTRFGDALEPLEVLGDKEKHEIVEGLRQTYADRDSS